jgi:hypothetical protein
MKSESEAGIDNIGVTIYFPEHFGEKGLPEDIEEETNKLIHGNIIKFVGKDYLIHTQLLDYKVPRVLSENPLVSQEIDTQIVKPAIETVKRDVSTVDDLLEEIRELVKEEKHEDNIYYERRRFMGNSKKFDVYDGIGAKNNYPFELLTLFRNVDYMKGRSLDIDYKTLNKAICLVNQTQGGIFCVSGSSLKEAIENYLTICNISDKLKINLDYQK